MAKANTAAPNAVACHRAAPATADDAIVRRMYYFRVLSFFLNKKENWTDLKITGGLLMDCSSVPAAGEAF
jgi:hypothetical protein